MAGEGINGGQGMPFAIATDVSAMPITLFETQSRCQAQQIAHDGIDSEEQRLRGMISKSN
jgi:hypothetical protein